MFICLQLTFYKFVWPDNYYFQFVFQMKRSYINTSIYSEKWNNAFQPMLHQYASLGDLEPEVSDIILLYYIIYYAIFMFDYFR